MLQQELQNPYWNLHDPIMTKSYQISKYMDIEMMPHAMYFTGDLDTVTKINHVQHQTIVYVMQPGSGEDPKLQSTPKMPPTEEAGLPTESS